MEILLGDSIVKRTFNHIVEEEIAIELRQDMQWVSRLVANRVNDVSQLHFYFQDDLEQLCVPSDMRNMEQASARIIEQINKGGRLVLAGDFDADGSGGVAIMAYGLNALGYHDFRVWFPNRLTENHGMNKRLLDEVKGFGASLIVTVDNGSSNLAEIEIATGMGVDVIVTDHHSVPSPEIDKKAIIVNPKHPDDITGDKTFCGAGIAFQLIRQLSFDMKKEIDLSPALQFAGISTMADVVPLEKQNRLLVRLAVEEMRRHPIPLISAICAIKKIDVCDITPTTLSWTMAPLLNSVGRLECADYAFNALLCGPGRAIGAAEYLESVNERRRDVMDSMLSASNDEIDENYISENLIVQTKMDWHLGVVGIFASRLAYQHKKVAGCGALDGDGNWRISFRSPGKGAAIDRAVEKAVSDGVALGGGGHDGAGGATVEDDKFDAFCKAISDSLSEVDITTYVDGVISPGFWSVESIQYVDNVLQPYGNANPEVSMAYAGRATSISVLKEKHIKFQIDGVACIAFNMADKLDTLLDGDVRIVYNPSVNKWRGNESVQAIVSSIESFVDSGSLLANDT